MPIQLSDIQHAIPPPEVLRALYSFCPHAVIAIRLGQSAILVETGLGFVTRLGTTAIPYHGATLQVCVIPWDDVESRQLLMTLKGKHKVITVS